MSMVLGDEIDSGLSLGQKSSLATKLLPSPKTSHPYIVGLLLITVGGLGLVGSLTGQLPSMIGALFVPNALTDANGNNGADFTTAFNLTPLGTYWNAFWNVATGK